MAKFAVRDDRQGIGGGEGTGSNILQRAVLGVGHQNAARFPQLGRACPIRSHLWPADWDWLTKYRYGVFDQSRIIQS
jgi:hypothetical protein